MADVEDLITTVRDYLVDNWTARVAIVNGTNENDGNDVTLGDLRKAFIAEKALQSVAEFPVLLVLADRSSNQGWHQNDDDYEHRVEISVVATDQDEEKVELAIFRYMEDVLWNLLKAGHFDSTITWHMVGETAAHPQIEWGAILTRGSGRYMKDARITVTFSKN